MDNEKTFEDIPIFSGTKEEIQATKNGLIAGGNTGKNLVQIRSPYVTAVSVQIPRSITKVSDSVFEEARLAGANFFYRWKVKNKDGTTGIVEGGSIDMAMSFARNYLNCASDIEVEETATHFIFKASVIDLETGFTFPRLFRQRKSQRMSKKMDHDRAEDMAFQIGQSKAQRNVWLKIMPNWMLSRAMSIAKDAESIGIKDLEKAKSDAKEYFNGLGVSDFALDNYIGKNFELWTKYDIVELRSVATALRENRTSISEVFGFEENDTNEETEPQEKAGSQKTDEATHDDSDKGEGKEKERSKDKSKTCSSRKKKDAEKPKEKDVKPIEKKEESGPKDFNYYNEKHPEVFGQVLKDLEFVGKDLSEEERQQVVIECETMLAEIQEKKDTITDPDKLQKYAEDEIKKSSEEAAKIETETENVGSEDDKQPAQEQTNTGENPFVTLRRLLSNDRAGIMKVKKELQIETSEYTESDAKRIVNAYTAKKGAKEEAVEY